MTLTLTLALSDHLGAWPATNVGVDQVIEAAKVHSERVTIMVCV